MEQDAPAVTMPCRVCSMQIPQTAKYCTHCKSYQDWRRFVPLGSAVVAFAAAAVSVIATASPALVKLFDPQDARLTAVPVGSSPGEHGISLLVLNTGTQTGSISDVHVTYVGPDKVRYTFPFEVDDRAANLVDAGASKLISAHIAEEIVMGLPDTAFNPKDGICQIEITTASSSGPHTLPTNTMACSMLSPAISNSGYGAGGAKVVS